jgi:hypothetical protein
MDGIWKKVKEELRETLEKQNIKVSQNRCGRLTTKEIEIIQRNILH